MSKTGITERGVRAFLVFLLAVAAGVCLVIGVTTPVVKLTRLYFWTDTHSLASIISALYQTGEIFLATIIFTFSILFPAFKLFYIVVAGTLMSHDVHARGKGLKRLEWLGKWSMLDVLVLALIVFYAKSTSLTDAVALPGIYFFAASVVLTMIAYGLIENDISGNEKADQGDKR